MPRDGWLLRPATSTPADLARTPMPLLRLFRPAGWGRQFAYDSRHRQVQYYTSYPIRDASGGIAGAAVLNKPMLAVEANLTLRGVHLLLDPMA